MDDRRGGRSGWSVLSAGFMKRDQRFFMVREMRPVLGSTDRTG